MQGVAPAFSPGIRKFLAKRSDSSDSLPSHSDLQRNWCTQKSSVAEERDLVTMRLTSNCRIQFNCTVSSSGSRKKTSRPMVLKNCSHWCCHPPNEPPPPCLVLCLLAHSELKRPNQKKPDPPWSSLELRSSDPPPPIETLSERSQTPKCRSYDSRVPRTSWGSRSCYRAPYSAPPAPWPRSGFGYPRKSIGACQAFGAKARTGFFGAVPLTTLEGG